VGYTNANGDAKSYFTNIGSAWQLIERPYQWQDGFRQWRRVISSANASQLRVLAKASGERCAGCPRWKTFATIAHASYANLWSNENLALVIFEKSL
jgi:hypothetical protein